MTTCITLLRNKPGWRTTPQAPTRGPIIPPAAWWSIAAACTLFVVIQMWLTDRYTVGTHRLTIAESLWQQTPAGQALAQAGYVYPGDVARALEHPAGRMKIAEALDWPGEDLEVAAGPILLAALPEVGPTDAYILTALDIFTVPMLARADPARIASEFPRQRIPNGDTRASPPLRRARVWVRASQREIARWPAWRHAQLSAPPHSDMMPPTHAE